MALYSINQGVINLFIHLANQYRYVSTGLVWTPGEQVEQRAVTKNARFVVKGCRVRLATEQVTMRVQRSGVRLPGYD